MSSESVGRWDVGSWDIAQWDLDVAAEPRKHNPRTHFLYKHKHMLHALALYLQLQQEKNQHDKTPRF